MKGKLTVICGPMFSGKSTELQRLGKRHILAKHNVIFIKPSMDNRYSEDEIVTHLGVGVRAISVGVDEVFHNYIRVHTADVVLIDEVQFFSNILISQILCMLEQGKQVYCSGLDMDFRGMEFDTTIRLMGLADVVTKVSAVCELCGEDAIMSAKISGSNETVELGSKDKYIPTCRTCHTVGGSSD